MIKFFNLTLFQSGNNYKKIIILSDFIFVVSSLRTFFSFLHCALIFCSPYLSPSLSFHVSPTFNETSCYNPDLICPVSLLLINDPKIFLSIQIFITYYCIHFHFPFYFVAFMSAFMDFYILFSLRPTAL